MSHACVMSSLVSNGYGVVACYNCLSFDVWIESSLQHLRNRCFCFFQKPTMFQYHFHLRMLQLYRSKRRVATVFPLPVGNFYEQHFSYARSENTRNCTHPVHKLRAIFHKLFFLKFHNLEF